MRDVATKHPTRRASPVGIAWAAAVWLHVSSGCDLRPAPVELAAISEAPKRADATRLKFRGVLKPEYLGTHAWRSGQAIRRGGPGADVSSLHMYAVPVVDEDWTPRQPVPLWLTMNTKDGNNGDPAPWVERMNRALEAGRVVGRVRDRVDPNVDPNDGPGWRKAIAAAQVEHGLKSAPQAPIVILEE